MDLMRNLRLVLIYAFLVNGFYYWKHVSAANVTYDHRSLLIDGQRRVLISGSIHYPRSTPEMWPDIIQKAKDGGLDVIESYVFWNMHEPKQNEYYFKDRFDLVKFVKIVQQAGLLVHLRIGPYACAEWNYGGFPVWLHLIPGIHFRTDNEPFKNEMQRFTAKIVDMMKQDKLFASQGGPIILAQIENEYGNVEGPYGAAGKSYVKWAASMAVGLNTGVPWVMCQQADAPDPIINTCNGFYCDAFTPNSPNKPKMWTENWSGWFLSFGGRLPFRPTEDLAFSVARFFQRGGTFQKGCCHYQFFRYFREGGQIKSNQTKSNKLEDLERLIFVNNSTMAEDSAPRDHRTGRRMFVHNANSVVTVTDGYMKAIDAQEVLLECLSAWGVSGHDENTIEPYVACIAQMLRQGTSAERDFTAVMFEIRGSWCSLESLRYAAMKRDSSENPVRVWARSYREGEIAVRIRDMLSDPNNVALRQEAALDYQCALDIVHVSFDFADALVKYPEIVLTQTERFAIRANTLAKVRSSRSNVLGGSDGGSMQDAAANAAAVSSAAPVASSGNSVQAGGARVRASFAPMR